ncbi:hypothetical protein [Mesorhizobium sp. B2-4-6]|nr:hypothetical protein [Mesorhizobium sp. B2-4-6]
MKMAVFRYLEEYQLCMSRKSVQRFCDNDMHENKALKARRLNPLQRDAL